MLDELHSFRKYLPSALDVPGTALGTGGTAPALRDFIFQCETSDDKDMLYGVEMTLKRDSQDRRQGVMKVLV